MLHTLKRATVGIGAARQEPVNAEFENLRNNLENVNTAIATALSDIAVAQRAWTSVLSAADTFSSGLHTLYPNDDAVRKLFKQSLDEVRGPVVQDLAAVLEPTSHVRGIDRMVRAYLTEIKLLQAEYVKVETARKDYAMYQVKVEKLSKREVNDDKEQRNLDKLEVSKTAYTAILDSTLHRMTTCYEKSPTMFRATYVAYWLLQSRMSDVIGNRLQGSFSYAELNASSAFNMSETAQHAKPEDESGASAP